MNPEPMQEHQWLQKMIGQWICEGEAEMEPGKPPEKWTANETVRTLGGLWVICEGQSDMPDGGKASNVMTLGFDPAKQRFVGSFIASVMTHFWVYEGTLDAERRVLTLDAEGPSFSGDGKMARYQDIITFVSDDHRTLSSRTLGEDGQWRQFMLAHYRRAA